MTTQSGPRTDKSMHSGAMARGCSKQPEENCLNIATPKKKNSGLEKIQTARILTSVMVKTRQAEWHVFWASCFAGQENALPKVPLVPEKTMNQFLKGTTKPLKFLEFFAQRETNITTTTRNSFSFNDCSFYSRCNKQLIRWSPSDKLSPTLHFCVQDWGFAHKGATAIEIKSPPSSVFWWVLLLLWPWRDYLFRENAASVDMALGRSFQLGQ